MKSHYTLRKETKSNINDRVICASESPHFLLRSKFENQFRTALHFCKQTNYYNISTAYISQLVYKKHSRFRLHSLLQITERTGAISSLVLLGTATSSGVEIGTASHAHSSAARPTNRADIDLQMQQVPYVLRDIDFLLLHRKVQPVFEVDGGFIILVLVNIITIANPRVTLVLHVPDQCSQVDNFRLFNGFTRQ